ncbi:MAG: bifunctional 4-hydroxy-3-methylbut-2-enyl diphosphate reductase/30S ribosomal protein S1 [Lachnospiraceae bacterium]|nr:bifunctional 4-hydroxy-3-methylbut-2-enyl diphosphate reductase/30S ribosomal protein S1 [Lachnospiraceae bacterium]
MKVILAKTAGFCFGVKRALDTAYAAVERNADNGIMYTLGPIIHNEQVTEDLEKRGVEILAEKEMDEVLTSIPEEKRKSVTVITRSHGIGKDVYDKLTGYGVNIVDATCPFVKKIHRIVEEKSREGKRIYIAGDKTHPEVQGIAKWCASKPVIFSDISELVNDEGDIDTPEGVVLCAQTTFNAEKFKKFVEFFQKKYYNAEIYNTICNATEERQREARALAADVDTMIVIGGKNSSNTQKLYEICASKCERSYYIQTLVDLDLAVLESADRVGITAGASTPNHIIKEVQNSIMAEESFEELLKASEEKESKIKPGSIVEGKIINVKPDEITVDIQYKADGIITRNEYSSTPNLDLTTVAKEGDPITVKVIKTNDGEGQVLLSYRRVAAEKSYAALEEAYEKEEVLKGRVTKVVDGGLTATVNECDVFIPASLVSDTYEKNLSKFMDTEVEFVITEFNPKKRRVIGNRKQLIAARKAEMAKALFERINVGDVVEGKVKNVTPFGAFIDLGGADGLLHISEMSWGRIDDPKSVVKVGDTVTTFIKEINGEKIALSLKFEDKNPWASAAERYAVGTVVKGKVARMATFGAFVELEPGVDALLHVSQISNQRVEKPEDVYKIGDEIEAKVVDLKLDEKKISLSVKALNDKAEEEAPAADDTADAPAEEE